MYRHFKLQSLSPLKMLLLCSPIPNARQLTKHDTPTQSQHHHYQLYIDSADSKCHEASRHCQTDPPNTPATRKPTHIQAAVDTNTPANANTTVTTPMLKPTQISVLKLMQHILYVGRPSPTLVCKACCRAFHIKCNPFTTRQTTRAHRAAIRSVPSYQQIDTVNQ